MKLEHICIPTQKMKKGMILKDFFEEVAAKRVPGLPYTNEEGEIIGRISLRDVYKKMAVPDNLLRFADALGDNTDNLDMSEIKVMEMMDVPVETYLLENIQTVSPKSSIVKALSLMERHNTSYLFLMEEDKYLGVISRMVIALRMLQCVKTKTGEE